MGLLCKAAMLPQVYPTGRSGHITHLPGPAWLPPTELWAQNRAWWETEHLPKCSQTHHELTPLPHSDKEAEAQRRNPVGG